MSFIIDAKTSFPDFEYSQEELSQYLGSVFPERKDVIQKIFKNALVEKRKLSLPLSSYVNLKGLESRNNHWQETATKLGIKNLEYIFNELSFPIADIKIIISTTITGLMIPSLEAKLMNLFPFDPKVKRIPILGLGCLGGAACIARAHDYLLAYPKEAALVLATELCSLTFQLDDLDMSNVVGTSLFADGAGVVLLVGREHPWSKRGKWEIKKTSSVFFPYTERIMGWDIVDKGFKLVLSGDVPKIVHENFAPAVRTFLDENKVTQEEIKFYISHPGGPKVLTSIEESLSLSGDYLIESYRSLKEHGNMSSVSVLNVLERSMKNVQGTKNLGLMLAMGPAFCAEMLLLKEV